MPTPQSRHHALRGFVRQLGDDVAVRYERQGRCASDRAPARPLVRGRPAVGASSLQCVERGADERPGHLLPVAAPSRPAGPAAGRHRLRATRPRRQRRDRAPRPGARRPRALWTQGALRHAQARAAPAAAGRVGGARGRGRRLPGKCGSQPPCSAGADARDRVEQSVSRCSTVGPRRTRGRCRRPAAPQAPGLALLRRHAPPRAPERSRLVIARRGAHEPRAPASGERVTDAVDQGAAGQFARSARATPLTNSPTMPCWAKPLTNRPKPGPADSLAPRPSQLGSALAGTAGINASARPAVATTIGRRGIRRRAPGPEQM